MRQHKIYTVLLLIIAQAVYTQPYKIVDTDQSTYYDNINEIAPQVEGDTFYGQDAQFQGLQPSYTNNNDGTITDNITGLIWTRSIDTNEDGFIDAYDKMTYDEAVASVSSVNVAGYTDWRLPSIKELYSLILFSGIDPPPTMDGDTDELTPFIDTDYFEFEYGDETADERIIDAQYWSSTEYVGTTMNGDETTFGVNFADGRIKGYPSEPVGPPGQEFTMKSFVRYVRGNQEYGVNDFEDNDDGTITDNATGLIWSQNDSELGLNWEEALTWIQQKNTENYLGYNDWRLPNAKELQSLIDYSRAPSITNSAAIDPIFICSVITDQSGQNNYPFYWTGTTHVNTQGGGSAAYVCFGESLGWMEMPPNSGNYQLLDVHGAGAQRSDPKQGDPNDWPNGNGPQGDVIRIYNYVRLVRGGQTSMGSIEENTDYRMNVPFNINVIYPNPFNATTTIEFNLSEPSELSISVIDIAGQEVDKLFQGFRTSGLSQISWNAGFNPSGVYFIKISSEDMSQIRKVMLLK